MAARVQIGRNTRVCVYL